MSEHIFESTSDNKAYVDRIAASWEDIRDSFFPVSLRETAFQNAGIVAGNAAADIGSGGGFLTEGLLER